MEETYLQRGIENPEIIDLITLDRQRQQVVLVMIEQRPWLGTQEQREQLNDKLNSYFVYLIDGHLVQQYPRYRGLPVRVQLDCVDEPGDVERGMLREATRLAAEHGFEFVVRLVAPAEIESAPWEKETDQEPDLGESLSYRPEVLAALATHGLRPTPTTRPQKMRALLNDLYVFEIREQRLRRRELESSFGEQPVEPYAERVRQLREKYSLLGLPIQKWVEGAAQEPESN